MRRTVLVAAGASLTACITLIGVEEVGYAPSIGGDAGGDGASEAGPAAVDASTGPRICALLGDGGPPPDLGARVSCGAETDIDLATDGRHCGECGHWCGEGVRCTSGQCLPSTQALVLRDGGLYPILVGADSQRFYWYALPGAVASDFGWIDRADGSVVSFPIRGLPRAAALTDEGVYVVSEGDIVLGARDGTGLLPRVQDARGLFGLSVGGPFVYFGAQADVMRLSRDASAGAVAAETLFQYRLGPSAAFAADAENVYFISPLGEMLRAPHGANYTQIVGMLPTDASFDAAPNQSGIGYLMAAGPYLYWADHTRATVYRLLAGGTGGQSELLAQAPGNTVVTAMTFDDDWIYWAAAPDASTLTHFTLLKSPRCGGLTRVLGRYDTFEADYPKGVFGLAVDSTYLYYGTSPYEIRRIRK